MKPNLSRFCLDLGTLDLDPEKDCVARIPADLRSKQELLRALSRELEFPDYFGHNWDALDECLRDFWWIKQRRVVIVHRDVPQLSPDELAIYLDVLRSAIEDWKPGDDHELVVVFPLN